MAVCLHCLHEARVAARERRQRIIIRCSVWTLGIAVAGAVVAKATGNAARHVTPATRTAARAATGPRVAAPPRRDSVIQVAVASPVVQQGSADTARPVVHDSVSAATTLAQDPAPAAAVADSATAKRAIAPLQTVLAFGRTDLEDSLFAMRMGDTVVVHFDTSPTRTRRADKFERTVRQTLRVVYGPIADTLLATVPEGRLAAPNELLSSLPTRGIHLATPDGRRIGLWPETRPGQDGPLVVAYRTLVER